MTEEKRDELEKFAIDIIKNHSHRLIKNFSETDLINREITIFFEGYRTAEREWKKCFLSCSSPFCQSVFPNVISKGELGNMEKEETDVENNS